MFNNISGDRTPYTASFSPGMTSLDERKAVREQKLEDSLAATQVAAPGPEQVSELSRFYNKALDSIEQIRYPVPFPAMDKKEGSDSPAASSNVQYLTGSEAAEQSGEIKSYINDEIGRLIGKDNSKDDLDKRKGHVRMECVEGDGYQARLEYDTKTRKPIHLESEVDGGRTWIYGYDRATGSTPETYSRETISPVFQENEGETVDTSLSSHLKQTVLKNADGTEAVRQEESVSPD